MMDAFEVDVRPGRGLSAAVPWRMSHGTQSAVLGVMILGLLGVAEFVMGDTPIIRGGAPTYVVLTSIGLGLLYTTIAGRVNYTYVTVDDRLAGTKLGYRERPAARLLRITIGPLPWPGGRSLPIKSVADLYVSTHGDRRVREFRLHALLTSGERTTLLRRFVSVEDAHYLMEHIADALELDRAASFPIEVEGDDVEGAEEEEE